MTLTAERLREVLDYDPETGVFTAKISRGRLPIGRRPGSVTSHGYLNIRVDGKGYYAHRLVWLYITGAWPANDMDHINGDRLDNRLSNLREATRQENLRNKAMYRKNKSNFKGVHFDTARRKWVAKIKSNDGRVYLGGFETPEEASAAYEAAANKYFGEFATIRRVA